MSRGTYRRFTAMRHRPRPTRRSSERHARRTTGAAAARGRPRRDVQATERARPTRRARRYTVRRNNRVERCVQPARPPPDPSDLRWRASASPGGRSERTCGGTCAGRTTWRLPHGRCRTLRNAPPRCQGLANLFHRRESSTPPIDVDPPRSHIPHTSVHSRAARPGARARVHATEARRVDIAAPIPGLNSATAGRSPGTTGRSRSRSARRSSRCDPPRCPPAPAPAPTRRRRPPPRTRA